MDFDYYKLLKGFETNGYKTIFFNELSDTGQLIIRHDIDYDCKLAYNMSLMEKENRVKATYFFMMGNPIYNLFSKENRDYIEGIKENGHAISIHFDPTIYDDISLGLQKEVDIFQSYFDTKVDIVSIHRPHDDFINNDNLINGIEHTYQTKYMKDIKYISDSRAEFRYGHPFESEEFKNNESIQLLIHPAWWMLKSNSIIDMIEKMIDNNLVVNRDYFRDNVIPYREYLEKD